MILRSVKTIFAASFICLITAQSKGGQGQKDTAKSVQQKKEVRLMSQMRTPHKIKLTSLSVKEEKKNAFRVEFSTKGFPNVRTRYLSGGDGTDHSVSSFRTGILCVCEYNDTILPSKSTNIVHLIGKKDISWSDIDIDENYNGTSATRAVTVGSGNGEFSAFKMIIELFFAPEEVLLGQKLIQPNTTKISITINGFPYKYDRGKVAIRYAIWSRSNRQNDENSVSTSGNIFTWDHNVIADAKVASIIKLGSDLSTSNDDEENEDDQAESSESHDFVIFGVNAEHAASIYWDPEMIQGEAEVPVSQGPVRSSGSTAQLSIIVLAISLLNAFI